MKKLLLMAFAVAMIAACSEKKEYKVSGTMEGAVDGDVIYLQNMKKEFIDSTKIANGKFTFTGVQKQPEIRFISAKKQPLILDFVLESGDIELAVTQKNKTDLRKGTKNNDALQSCESKIADNDPQAIMESIMTEEMSDSQLLESKNKLFAAIKGYNKTIDDFTAENKDSFVGKYVSSKYPKINITEDQISAIIDDQIKSNAAQKQTAVGSKFTDFTLQNQDGKEIKLSDFAGKGKYVLVDFWASWCKPCCNEMPNLVNLYSQYKDNGFEIVGVSLDREKKDAWKKAIGNLNMIWVQMLDVDGGVSQLYGVNAIPHTVLIDKDGTIIARNLRGAELQQKLAELLK